MDKQTLVGMLRSKTINVNVWLTLAIIYYAETKGIPLDPNLAMAGTAALYGIVNAVLRNFTTKSLPEKGITVPNPVYVQDFFKAASENPEALEALYEALAKVNKKKKVERQLGVS